MGQECAFWAEADRGNFGPLLRGMEHWSEVCWSKAWGFGLRHGAVWSEACLVRGMGIWSEACLVRGMGCFGPRLGAGMAHGIGSE